ncbi:hypothetical protein IAU60_001238 [Kwoniella sp. DSM 27419]
MTPAPASLPPYLTSGASSRAHHALLVRLNEAASQYEEDEVVSREIALAKEVLAVQGQSMGKIADTLIILLHCSMLRHRTDDSVEFGLVAALQLAEGGRNVAEKRIGYMYLAERLPADHELGLLLINTIRKDLASASPAHTLLALHTICKLPSSDLGPAVIPLLTSRTLLKHKVPAIRQRTFEALLSLHRLVVHRQGQTPFPLSMSKILRSIAHEEAPPVLSVLLRLVRHVIETDAHVIENDDQRIYVLEVILDSVVAHEVSVESQIALDVVRAFEAVMARPSGLTDSPLATRVAQWISSQLDACGSYRGREGAFLLAACRLVALAPAISPRCLAGIRQLVRPPDPAASTSGPALPSPNDHALALQCLLVLAPGTWDGRLGEAEMSVIMQGVNSADDTIRRMTVRLLNGLSPDLPKMILRGYVDSLRELSDLSLPLAMTTGLTIEEKTAIGRYETASRGIEVVEVLHPLRASSGSSSSDGAEYARGVCRVYQALEDGHARVAWDEGLRRVMARVGHESEPFREGFTTALLDVLEADAAVSSSTVLSIFCTVVCEKTPPSGIATVAVDVLTERLPAVTASLRELILIAIISLLASLSEDAALRGRTGVSQAVGDLDLSRSKQRREAMMRIIEGGHARRVMAEARSHAPQDVLDAILLVHAQQREAASGAVNPSLSAPDSIPPRTSMTASQLRYDAYAPPRLAGKGRARDYRGADDGYDDDD